MRASHLLAVAALLSSVSATAAETDPSPNVSHAPVTTDDPLIWGKAVLRVTFDQNGQAIKCEVVSSTGSSVLLQASEKFILTKWKNPQYANRVETVPLEFRYPHTLPRPPYPRFALAAHFEGTVVVSVKFDSSGDVVDCKVIHSSAEKPLDDYTCHFVKEYWSDEIFAGKTEQVPITYKLQ